MKSLRVCKVGWLFGLLAIAISGRAQYNMHPSLGIGDPAPAIKVEGWARGVPVTGFERGQVYVLDFWATWCGGCIASFPHISAIAEKYKGRVHFCSVDSYEVDEIKKGNDPMDAVKAFLKTPQGQRLTLDVCVDGKDTAMYKNWVGRLRRNGFPTTFVIDQEGRIAWVDVNLDNLDWVLGQVLAGTWDIPKAAVVMRSRDHIEDLFFQAFQMKDKKVQDDKYREILRDCDSLEQAYPDRKDAAAFYKLMALNDLDKARVPQQLEQMAADPQMKYIFLDDGVGLTLRRTDLTPRDYAAIAKAQERLLSNEHNGTGHGGKTVTMYAALASSYFKAGQRDKAVSAQEKAIAIADKQKVADKKVNKLKADLHGYQDAAKS